MKYLFGIFTVILLGVFAWAAVANVVLGVRYYVHGKRSTLVPLVGGVLGAIGCLIAPWTILRTWWWLPLLIDIGCAPMLLAMIVESIMPHRE